MVHRRDPLSSRSQNNKVIKRKPRPQWDSSINDVSSMKLSKTEQEKRAKLYSAKHMEKIRNEIKSMQKKEKSLQNAIHSSPFVAHNKSIVDMEVNDTRTKLQELLNETDRKMAEAKDLFGDHGFKYRVIPNVTSAPHLKHSPITLSRRVVNDTPSPPTALNDTQKLGIVTVETLPPDNSSVDLTRIRHLLNQEKENLLLTAQNTLLNSTTANTAPSKVNKVLDFNEDIPTVRMGDRSRRKVRISDSEGADNLQQDSSIWSHVPVEATQVVVSTKPDKRDSSLDSSPPRLRESSSESLVSPSRIKKQQSLERRNKVRQGDVENPSRDDKSRTPETSPSPVRIATKKTTPPPARSTTTTTRNSGNSVDSAPPLSSSVSEHHYPQILNIPVIKENSDVESLNDDGTEEDIDPVRGSRSPSGRKPSPRSKLVNTATSPLPTSQPSRQTHSIATSPVRGLESPVKDQGDKETSRIVNTERESYDRHYTDQELKDRLERLIVGGHYPFAKIEQKSYAIADPNAKLGDQNSEKEVGSWIRANFASEGENLTFVDSSPLKGAALDLELKLRKYQSQIGAKPAKNNAPVGGFSGYTSLLLRSVSTMIGYLTEQESGTIEEQNMRAEVIETMSALQNTVEALSTELLACRKDLSETKEKVQAMEHDYSTTLMFLVDNCVLKDPSLQTPLSAQRVKQLPPVISPFTTSPSQPPASKTPDLMTFTPHPNKSDNLIEFTPALSRETDFIVQITPAQSRETDSIVQISPETSEQYLQFLEEKTEALRSGLDEKMNRLNVGVDQNVVFPEIIKSEVEPILVDDKSYVSAPNKSSMSSLNFSNLTDDGLDLSQDLDALINRLKQMNAQTLAVTSQQMGLTPRKSDKKVDENLSNIKDMLDVEQTKPLEAATIVIESYKRQSDFSPSQLLPDFEDQTPDYETKHSKGNTSDQLASSSLLSTEADISPVFISPPAVVRGPGRISGEFIGTFSGTKPVVDRPVTPNPMSPRRVQEEIKRSTEVAKQKSPAEETLSEVSSTSQSSPNRPDKTTPNTKPNIQRSNSAILQSPSAFSPPTKESPGTSPRDQTSTESSPKQDKAALINDFLSHNPHYLKKISESLASASLPSFPTSPTQVSTARVSRDDNTSNGALSEGEKSPPIVKSSLGNPGVTEAVVRGSVTKNIAKFEKKREEAELERERSISPKRSPVRRGKSGSGRSPGRPRSALSPERKPGSPERRVKHRVSWGDDKIVQEAPLDRDGEHPKARPKIPEVSEEESEIVMKPDRTRLPERRFPDKNKNERKLSEKTKVKQQVQGAKGKIAKGEPMTNGGLVKSGSPEEAGTSETGITDNEATDSRKGENGEIKFARSESSGSDMMAHLMSMNDAKLTELMTTLNKLTER